MAFATDPSASVKKQLEAALLAIASLEAAEIDLGTRLQESNEAGEVQAETLAKLTEDYELLAVAVEAKAKETDAALADVIRITSERDAAMQAKGDFDLAVEEAASRKALAISAAQGVPANLIPAAKPSDGTGNTVGTVEDLWAQYRAIPSAEGRTAFYNAHRDEFVKAVR